MRNEQIGSNASLCSDAEVEKQGYYEIIIVLSGTESIHIDSRTFPVDSPVTCLLTSLIHLFRKVPDTTLPVISSRDKELTDRFLFLVRTQFSTLRGVADYAKRIHVSANHLNCVIKKVTGKTARYHIYQQIILEAKKKVNQDNGSLKEVAAFLGFDDPAHFSKFFKKNCGVNFSVFKKTYRYEI